ncbi:hypothetical protein [Streptomyces sp. NPDC097981]|uniref:hypothetical protein n=1 Tax=Streptomyces sp. NPDC097981 TaxID=3155428 RepID=UPI00332101F8
MKDDQSWDETKLAHPVGTRLQGEIQAKFPFGVFVSIAQEPGVKVFMDIASYAPNEASGEETSLPEVGEKIEGTVVDHVDRDQQIRIRVGQPFWDAETPSRPNGPTDSSEN